MSWKFRLLEGLIERSVRGCVASLHTPKIVLAFTSCLSATLGLKLERWSKMAQCQVSDSKV